MVAIDLWVTRHLRFTLGSAAHPDDVADFLVRQLAHVRMIGMIARRRLQNACAGAVTLTGFAVAGDAVGLVELSAAPRPGRPGFRRHRRPGTISPGRRRLLLRRARDCHDQRAR